jgi:hypothetical protein
MTPTEILDLAMAYKNTPANKMLSGKLGNMVNVANDLAKLNGTTQLDAKTRGKNPALILFLLKNGLVTKEEYIDLYKELLTKQISVIKSLKNADPASRMVGGAAARQAHKDMKGEFDESVVNEMGKNDVHFKEIMKMYDRGGSFTKKKVAVVVCKNPRASRRDIEEQLLRSQLILVPNPATDKLKIVNTSTQKISKLCVLDFSGKKIAEMPSVSTINIADYASGIYFVRVIMENGIVLPIKFVKQ